VALWTTGVSASSLGRQLSSEVDRSGRVPVLPDLSLKDHPEVLVLGDLATLKDAKGHVVPGLASAAVQMGSFAGHSILRDLKGQPRHPFVYLDKGTMATIGRNRAVAMIGRFQIAGLVAWLMWGLVHIVLLIGFRNRLSVMWEWIWAYVTGQGNARLITGRDEESSEPLPAREAPKASAR